MKASPRCPYCNTQGIKNIAAKTLGPVLLIYCGQCGAIFGALPTLPAANVTPAPTKIKVQQPAPPGPVSLPPKPSPNPIPAGEDLSPEQAFAILQRQNSIAKVYKKTS